MVIDDQISDLFLKFKFTMENMSLTSGAVKKIRERIERSVINKGRL